MLKSIHVLQNIGLQRVSVYVIEYCMNHSKWWIKSYYRYVQPHAQCKLVVEPFIIKTSTYLILYMERKTTQSNWLSTKFYWVGNKLKKKKKIRLIHCTNDLCRIYYRTYRYFYCTKFGNGIYNVCSFKRMDQRMILQALPQFDTAVECAMLSQQKQLAFG